MGMHDWTEKTEMHYMIDREIEQAAGMQEERTLLSPGNVSDVQIRKLIVPKCLQC